MTRNPRWRPLVLIAAPALTAAAIACGSADDEATPDATRDAGKPGRDSGLVDPLDGGDGDRDAGIPPPAPSCAKYCDLVQQNCAGEHAQYATHADCLAFCAHLPPGDPFEEKSPSLACRQYYAGNPALTDPALYCATAGPFGGGLCGDRCTAFCQVTLSACGPDGGAAPYPAQPDCKTSCATFTFRDAGTDGGGEGLDGPEGGDTLNCRLFHLREAVVAREACDDLGVDASACR